MPRGVFGTRADLFMDASIVFLTLLPVLIWRALRFAREKRYVAHRNMQIATLAVVLAVLVLFELDVRLTGGPAQFLAQAPERASFVRALMRLHIAVASLTFIAWFALALVSWKRLGNVLPGSFTRLHRRLGWTIFVGACFLSSSGALTYALVYVF
jgi:uncharacterized membrane protein YozB (DUF420 family)